jgi:hypothetical protein
LEEHEDGVDMFLQNVGCILADYLVLYPGRKNSSSIVVLENMGVVQVKPIFSAARKCSQSYTYVIDMAICMIDQ